MRPHCKPKDIHARLQLLDAELAQQYPTDRVEVWSFDEHHLGLKPMIRKVWAPVGQRQMAAVEPRYK